MDLDSKSSPCMKVYVCTDKQSLGCPLSKKDLIYLKRGFPGGSDCKESASYVGDLGLIPVLGRSPGEGDGNPLQYS